MSTADIVVQPVATQPVATEENQAFRLHESVMASLAQDEETSIAEAMTLAVRFGLFQRFPNPLLEREFRRYVYVLERWLPSTILVIALVVGVGAFFVRGHSLIAACVVAFAATVLGVLHCSFVGCVTADPDHEASSVAARRAEIMFAVQSFVTAVASAVAIPLAGVDCGFDEASTARCTHSFFFGIPLSQAVIALTVRRPLPTMIAEVVFIVVLTAVTGVSPPFSAPYVILRTLLSFAFYGLCCVGVVWHDRRQRSEFVTVCLVSFAERALDHERRRTLDVISRAMPKEVAKRIGRSGAVLFETDTSSRAVVSIAGTRMTASADPSALLDELTLVHNVFTLFDAGVAVFEVDRGVTFGDEYVATGGLVVGSASTAPKLIRFALWQLELTSNRLPLTAAVAAGYLSGGLLGEPGRLRYSLSGPAMSHARRLKARADPGVLLVHEAALRLARVSNLRDIAGATLATAYELKFCETEADLPALSASESDTRHELTMQSGSVVRFVPQQRVASGVPPSPSMGSLTRRAVALVEHDATDQHAPRADVPLDFLDAETLYKFSRVTAPPSPKSRHVSESFAIVPPDTPNDAPLIANGDHFAGRDGDRIAACGLGSFVDPQFELWYRAVCFAEIRRVWDRVPLAVFVLLMSMIMAGALERFYGSPGASDARRFQPTDSAGFVLLSLCSTFCIATVIRANRCPGEIGDPPLSPPAARGARRSALDVEDPNPPEDNDGLTSPKVPYVCIGALVATMFLALYLITESVISLDPFYIAIACGATVPQVLARPLPAAVAAPVGVIAAVAPALALSARSQLVAPGNLVATILVGLLVLLVILDATVGSRRAFCSVIRVREIKRQLDAAKDSLRSIAASFVPHHAVGPCFNYIHRAVITTTDQQLRAGGQAATEALLGLQRRPTARPIPVVNEYKNLVVVMLRLSESVRHLQRASSCLQPAQKARLTPQFVNWIELRQMLRLKQCFRDCHLDHFHVRGDDLLIAGPFGSHPSQSQVRPSRVGRAVLCMLDGLNRSNLAPFTAACAFGDAVGVVLGHGSLRYDLFGPAISDASTLLAASFTSRNMATVPDGPSVACATAAFASTARSDVGDHGAAHATCESCQIALQCSLRPPRDATVWVTDGEPSDRVVVHFVDFAVAPNPDSPNLRPRPFFDDDEGRLSDDVDDETPVQIASTTPRSCRSR
jgi:class 3 adenylate cyclase